MAVLSERDRRDLVRLRRAMARAEQAFAELDRILLAADGLCSSDLAILERLARKGARPVNGLARRIGLTSGSMTVAVQRLRRRKLVDTRRDLDDKRVVWVSVTRDGEELAERIAQVRGEALGQVFTGWSARECSVLTNLLKRLRKSAERALLDVHNRT